MQKDNIVQISTKLKFQDILGGWLVRLGIGRMNYNIEPGLYKVGNPNKNSDVLVTANYKLTFDTLRKELTEVSAWILVLDTKGINVWCAAGKGTFGTKELIERLKLVELEKFIDHKKLILPQLGAVGVSAYRIKASTGFDVIYGPVRAKDVKFFLDHEFTKTDEMRKVLFDIKDRATVIGVELKSAIKWFSIVLSAIILLKFFLGTFDLKEIIYYDFIPLFGAVLTGTVLFPLLLPFLPFQAFAVKGCLLGLIFAIFISVVLKMPLAMTIDYILILTPITSFIAMNFTGASTFTCQTGAALEVKIGTPIMVSLLILGIIFNILIKTGRIVF